MNSYPYIRFDRYHQAKSFASRLPAYAFAKVVPVRVTKYRYAFAVNVDRHFVEPRSKYMEAFNDS